MWKIVDSGKGYEMEKIIDSWKGYDVGKLWIMGRAMQWGKCIVGRSMKWGKLGIVERDMSEENCG